jgi:hypothetical protein
MKYEYVSEDNDTFKIKHPDGSEFSIAKNAVGKEVHKRIIGLKPQKMAEGGIVEEDPNKLIVEPSEDQGVQSYKEPLIIEEDRAPAASQLAVSPEPAIASAPTPQTPQAPQNTPQSAPDFLMSKESSLPYLAQQQKLISDVGKQQQQNFNQQSNVFNKLANESAKVDAHLEATLAPIRKENEALFNEINTARIDPNRVWHNMSTGSKVLSAISLILGGIGAGLTKGPNLALKVLDDSIDRDIEAQKADVNKKESLYSFNLKRLGDEKSAAAATKGQLLTTAQAQIASLGARNNSQQSQLNTQRAILEIEQKKDELLRDAGYRHMGMKGGDFDPALLVEKLVPKERQAEVFKEIKDAQSIRLGSKEALDAFDKAKEEQSVFSKNVIPGVNSPYIGKIKAAVLPQFQNIDGTVRQAAMDAFLPTVTPAVGDNKHTIDVKRQTLQSWLISHSSAPTAKGYKIDLDKFLSTTTQGGEAPVERMTKDGKVALFNPVTKQFVGYKQ